MENFFKSFVENTDRINNNNVLINYKRTENAEKARHSLPHLPVSSYTALVNISAPGAKSCSGDAIRNQTLKATTTTTTKREKSGRFH